MSGVLGDAELFRLTGIVRDEMHFLPAFLPHYRKLGVGQFIFLDDGSTDGSLEFLAAQNDVVVLKSSHRFGDHVDGGAIDKALPKDVRREIVWRMLLRAKFATDRFALHLDVDEFLSLPGDMTLRDLSMYAEAEGVDAIWAAMIDVYPAAIGDLPDMQVGGVVDLDAQWYFDAVPLIRLRDGRLPKTINGGSRARLLLKYGLHGRANWFDRYVSPLIGLPPPSIHNVRKPVFCRWRDQTLMTNSHSIDLRASNTIVLPLRHFKFCASTADHAKTAIADGMYFKGSADYKSLDALLTEMAQDNGSFMYRNSRLWNGYEACAQAGTAKGL